MRVCLRLCVCCVFVCAYGHLNGLCWPDIWSLLKKQWQHAGGWVVVWSKVSVGEECLTLCYVSVCGGMHVLDIEAAERQW